MSREITSSSGFVAPAFDQPHLLGHATIANVSSFLDGKLKLLELCPAITEAQAQSGTAHDEWLCIFLWDYDQSGYLLDTVRATFVTRNRIDVDVPSGVLLYRNADAWLAAPGICAAGDAAKCFAVLLNEPWAVALARLARVELEPLLRLVTDRSIPQQAAAVQEARARVEYLRACLGMKPACEFGTKFLHEQATG